MSMEELFVEKQIVSSECTGDDVVYFSHVLLHEEQSALPAQALLSLEQLSLLTRDEVMFLKTL